VPWLLPVTGTGWRPAPHARPGGSRAAGGRSEASRFMPAARSPAQRRSPAGPGPWIGGLPPLADAAGRRAGRPPAGPRGRPARLRLSGDPGRVLDVIEHADHLADWLNAADLPSVAMLGTSFGCQVAVELAVRHPDRVAALVLVARPWIRRPAPRPGRSSGGCGTRSGRTPCSCLSWSATSVTRDRTGSSAPWPCPARPDPGQASPGQGAGAGHPGQPQTHRAAGLGADRHPTLVSPGLRRAARVRVGAAGGAAELRQSNSQRHRRLPLDASIRTAAFGYVAWMAVTLAGLVAAGRCPTV
jgi:pimeloyl-ACP methyl ester carboxylesterase